MIPFLPRPAAIRSLLLLGLALPAAGVSDARAQSVGFEAGLAGVENYDPLTPALGISAFLPLTERLRGAVSYTQWTGCNAGDCAEPRTGYGNRGLSALALFRALGSSNRSLSLGAGMSWYEMHRLRDGGSDAYYDQAMTFATELRRAVAYNSSVYVRGEASIPWDDRAFRWGALRLGVDVRPF